MAYGNCFGSNPDVLPFNRVLTDNYKNRFGRSKNNNNNNNFCQYKWKGQEKKSAFLHIKAIYRHGSDIRLWIVTRELLSFSTIADIILRLRSLKTERITTNFLYPKRFSIYYSTENVLVTAFEFCITENAD